MKARLAACSLCVASLLGCNMLATLFRFDEHDVDRSESAPLIQSDSDLLVFTDFHINEARFNPSVESPAALTIMSSTTFHNASGERLAVRFPRFKLEINGVYWTDLASTDFQIGRLQTKGALTIELQSLLLMKNVNEKQQPVVEAIQAGEAVDIYISGTILIFPDGNETVVSMVITQENLVLPSEWLHADAEG